jgi:ankyrin repeat protein
MLLEHGADVDARLGTVFGGGGGETALIEAAQEGKATMLSLLIENKADLDAQDQYGQTALHRAAFNGMLLIVQLLVQAGCKTDIKDGEGILAVQRILHSPPCPCY